MSTEMHHKELGLHKCLIDLETAISELYSQLTSEHHLYMITTSLSFSLESYLTTLSNGRSYIAQFLFASLKCTTIQTGKIIAQMWKNASRMHDKLTFASTRTVTFFPACIRAVN